MGDGIPAALVKELRDATSAGMMDCKRALEETGGDLDEAIKLLREKGMASAAKRAERETTEGTVLARVENGRGTLIAVGCETEPVSKNDDFRSFAEHVLQVADEQGPDALDALEAERVELVAKIGENVAVRGAARYEAESGEVVYAYVHPPANKIGVLVRVKGTSELAKMLAQHISFANPAYAGRDEIPEADIAAEREIYERLPDVASKPAEIRAKIVDGMLQKRFFAERVLTDQTWIYDDSITVGKALAEHSAEVRDFVRFALGR
jgi:elongation factor Ts